MSGWKQWQVAEVVDADDFQTYLQNQVVQVYASSTARSTTLGTAVSEGMVSYLEDVNSVEYYNGSSWQGFAVGDITAVTAGTGLTGGGSSGDVTLNVNYAAVGSAVLASPTVTGTATIAAGTVTGNFIVSGTATLSSNTSIGSVSSTEIGYLDGVTSAIQTQLNAKAPFTQPVEAKNANYTITAADANDLLYFTNSAAATATFPDLLSVGDRIDIVRDGAGTVVLAAGTGVTSWGGAGTAGTTVTFKIDQQYNAATVYKVAAATYRVVGKIAV